MGKMSANPRNPEENEDPTTLNSRQVHVVTQDSVSLALLSKRASAVRVCSIRLTIFVMLITMSLLSCRSDSTLIGEPAPDVQFKTLQGEVLNLREMARPVLVSFWSTSCSVCIAEMPELAHLYETYEPQGFELIAVALPSDRPDAVLNLAEEKNLPYPVAIDLNGSVLKQFEPVRVTPTTFLISADGKIVNRYVGRMNMDKLRASIDELLA